MRLAGRSTAIGLIAGMMCTANVGCRPEACRTGQRAQTVKALRSPVTGYHQRSHAHNDELHSQPLQNALEQRFYSVEADTWLIDGQLLVGHDESATYGKLVDRYLDPL